MQQFDAQTTVLNVLLYKTKEVSNTKNINVNVTRPPVNIPLGRQGENRATCVTFDCTGLVQLYGDGTAELLHELKDGTVYPVAIKQDGTSVSWIVTASDTATVGAGRAELRWYVGDTLAKSAKFRTSVSSALADTSVSTPPAPQQSWVDKVLAAAQEIKDGAISDEKLAAAIAAYLADHPIDAGLDETALAAYLTENGYLTNTELADTVAQALAEAKASGEFDGAPGRDGADGSPGADGADGVGIQSVEQTITSIEDGGTNIVTVTKTDGTTSTFQVKNGSKGSDGVPGKDGANGADGQPGTNGKSAYQYAVEGGYTGTEVEFASKLAEEMPDTLPNPNALIFTGAVTGSYDGSAPLEVAIPSGGGESGDYIPNPSTASVGQTIVVKAVDENGKPTEWEAADMASGGGEREWALIEEITLEETVSKVVKVLDTPCDELLVVFSNLLSTPNNSIGVGISINGVGAGDTRDGMFAGAFVHNSAPARGIIQIVKVEDYWYGIVSGINSGINANGLGITRPSRGNGKTKIESFNFWVSSPATNSICAGATLKIYTR